MTRKLIIDTDPGVDDAMAIFTALATDALDVVALTTIFGNAAIDVTTHNAAVLLEAAGRPDIPIARGESAPVAAPYKGPVPFVHGHNGLGDAELETPTIEPVDDSAADLIASIVRADPGNVSLLALGPLTNLAVVMDRHPDVIELVDEVVVMGGNALVPGNATPVAEANINNDPEAADRVLGAPWRVTMVGLDVTHRVNLRSAQLDRIASTDTPSGRLLAGALPLYRDFYARTNGIDGIFVHDPSAVAVFLDPDAFTVQNWAVRVETESFSRGKTWPNMGNTDESVPEAWQGRPTVGVCTDVDGERVAALVEELLTRR